MKLGRLLGAALLVVAACGSSSSSTGDPAPGSNAPGTACTTASDCGCWSCVCKGISGEPGAAQLCVSGVCPSGMDACAQSCDAAGASVESATATASCDGRP